MSSNSYYPRPLNKITYRSSKVVKGDFSKANIEHSLFKARLKNRPGLWSL